MGIGILNIIPAWARRLALLVRPLRVGDRVWYSDKAVAGKIIYIDPWGCIVHGDDGRFYGVEPERLVRQ